MKNTNKYSTSFYSQIVAQVIISESEIKKVIPEYTYKYEETNPDEFLKIMYDLGIDTKYNITRQDGLWHRNRLNEVVLCSRWVGEERLDEEWIKSGYASKEAIDKVTGNKILEDLYRSKNLTKDTQEVLESKDRYAIIDETLWLN